jgi:hypothetical protein
MSTSKIEEALKRFGMESRNSQTDLMVAQALKQLAALRNDAKALVQAEDVGGVSRVRVEKAWANIRTIAAEYAPDGE